jgi:hypothetical protein
MAEGGRGVKYALVANVKVKEPLSRRPSTLLVDEKSRR